jgi:hypothetical protein
MASLKTQWQLDIVYMCSLNLIFALLFNDNVTEKRQRSGMSAKINYIQTLLLQRLKS